MDTTATTRTRSLRAAAARPTASNVDYWAFRSRSDADAADAEARAR